LVKRRFRISAGLLGVAVCAATLFQYLVMPQEIFGQDAHPEDTAIIRHLNAAITWYKQLTSANESAGQPSDAVYLENARILARQAMQLAFQSAEAEAAILLAERGGQSAAAGPALSSQTSGEKQSINKSAASTAAQITQIQTQIGTLNNEIPNASGKKLQDLVAKRESLQDQLDFNQALQEALQKLSTFMNGNGRKSGGLLEEIDDLKKSVPTLFAETPGKDATPAATPNTSAGSGLISQGAMIFSRSGDIHEINQLISGVGSVSQIARQVQAPLRTRLRATIDQGRGLANQPVPPDAVSQEQNREKITSLTARFKQISNATIPLVQEIILLDESQASLQQWEESAHRGYVQDLKSFLLRLGTLLIGIIIVVGISEFWRRATFRYVHEARMRHQLLLTRHIITALLLAVVLAMGFVNEFGSLATFAGFVAAGIAVALQTLLLSVAGYFFLIGRHGIMVGDRISVSGVTGDVIYVGLVRLYLNELAGAGSDLHPTGRVVVISNSVLFLGIPLLKQIPGTAYAWHEVVVDLERDSDYTKVESKLLEAVNSVYAEYREEIEAQHQSLKGLMTISTVVPIPQARLQLVEKGLNLIVRYPVVLHRETEIDNQMARTVVALIHNDPELKAAVGSPTIRPAIKA